MSHFNYGGMTYSYNRPHTTFTIEVGRFSNAYKVQLTLTDPEEAIMEYEARSVGEGYKKRLCMTHNGVKKTIARLTSHDPRKGSGERIAMTDGVIFSSQGVSHEQA